MTNTTQNGNYLNLASIITENPNLDMLTFNFFDKEAVNQLGWGNMKQGEIDQRLDSLKAYQRLLRLGSESQDAIALCQGQHKLDSAQAIASLSEEAFVEVANFMDADKARMIHREARQKTAGSMVFLANVIQFSAPRHAKNLFDNAENLRSGLGNIPSYQELFGSLDFLQCDPCQSIFSPAAYFVDLMRMLEEYITETNEELKLKIRRPDLEKILLTCDNTKDTVPYTQIVSEVLEAKLQEGQEDIFKELASAKYPRNLPFNLYLEQIRLYLGDLGTNLADIYQTYHPDDPYSVTWAREYLGLSREEYDLIITKDATDECLEKRYGVDNGNILDVLKKKEAFLKQTKLSWQELDDLLYQNLSPKEIGRKVANQFYINANSDYLDLRDDGKEFKNLSKEQLDRIDRFLRLAKKLNWSFADLDWLLASISADDNKKIDAEAIQKIAKIKRLQIQTKLPLEVLCSFWHKMKTIGKGDKPDRPQDLFDRVFNNYFTIRGQETWEPGKGYNWKIKNGDEKDLVIRKRLLAALQLSDEDLTDIVEDIWSEQEEVKLNLAYLSMLYRHALMLKLLGLKAQEYQLLLKCCGESLQNLKKLEIDTYIEIFELAQWIKVSGFSVYELDYILVHKEEDILQETTEYPSVEVFLPKKKMAASMESLWKKVQLPDPIEVKLAQLNDEKLAEIRKELKGRLTDEELGQLTVEKIKNLLPKDPKKLNDLVNEKLTEREVEKVNKELNEQIAHHFGIEPGIFSVLASLGADFAQENDEGKKDYLELLLTKVDTKQEEDGWSKIVKCLQYISKMLLLASKLELAEADMRNIQKLYHKDYEISSLTHLTIKNIQTIYKVHSQLLKIFHQSEENFLEYLKKSNASKSSLLEDSNLEDRFGKLVEHLDIKDQKDAQTMEEAKKIFHKHKNPEGASVLDELAKQMDWNKEQIKETIEYLQLNKKGDGDNEKFYNSVEGLLKLKQCFDLCKTIGSNIDFPRELCNLLKKDSATQNWDNYKNLAHSVTSLVKAKYNDEEWEKVFEKLNGTLEERKCQILSDFALYKLKYENLRELSEYLLLDVEMTSCSCNSRIQLAILSVQNYLQRCRMGIEPGVTEVKIPPVWWEWIMNYRKWEANRKVFLYPENYIDPSLRKDGSPIFKELQDELLQSDITAESVETAYRNYFDKLAELAKLQVVEGCRYWVTTPKSPNPIDTLFLFAKTITEPRTFYYRTCEHPEAEKPLWGYWQKIDLQINSDYLASVYAFNRLFVFWVETKEIKKDKEQPATTQATVKYSFLNASQNWVSPQTLVADVDIPQDFKVKEIIERQENSGDVNTISTKVVLEEKQKKVELSFWQQVYPIVVPDEKHNSEMITTVFGGLQSISSSDFDAKERIFFAARNKIITEEANQALKSTIDSNFLLATKSWEILNKIDNFDQSLSKAQDNLAAATVGNLVVFAGGSMFDVFAYKNGKLEKQKTETELKLSQPQDNLAAATIGNLVVFAGGSMFDVFAYKNGKLEKQKTETELKLSQPQDNLAAATIGNLVVFAGGSMFDVFAYKNGKLEKQKTETELKLSQPQANLAAATIGNLVVFAGGSMFDVFAYKNGKLEKQKTETELKLSQSSEDVVVAATVGDLVVFAADGRFHAFAYKNGKLEKQQTITLPYGRDSVAVATVGNLVVFAGGFDDSYDSKIDVFAYKNGKLEKQTTDLKLSGGRYSLAAATVGNLVVFTGGVSYKDSRNKYGYSNHIEVFYTPIPDLITLKTLPSGKNELPEDTTVSPIKNQKQGLIFQHQSQAVSYLGLAFPLTRLTTSTIQQFSHTLFAKGLDGLLSLESQQIHESYFPDIPNNQLDFDGAYGAYFWEIFFHIPFLIASTLNAHQRYNEARQWYQYIFNPTIPDKYKDRFWCFLPFLRHTPKELKQTLSNTAAIQAYKENPFDPYAIARLRIGAYEKAVVMKYIDNLLNWGDALFTQDNWESITQATTLYLFAYDLLGEKPKNLGKPPAQEPKTFADIKAGATGDMADFLIDLENRPEYQEFIKQLDGDVPFNALDAYFCVSENQEFAKYWDRVEDRLFKIRHCQNIKGIERQLALFSPPIDPKQLVRQAAAGDGSMALPTLDQIPNYRFSYFLERSKGMVSTVIQLGSTLLNTLEKKDAEELAVLRATQEPILLQLITKTKEKQIEEAEANLVALQQSKKAAEGRLEHYRQLIEGISSSNNTLTKTEESLKFIGQVADNISDIVVQGVASKVISSSLDIPTLREIYFNLDNLSKLGLNPRESLNISLLNSALPLQIEANSIRAMATLAYLIPNIIGLATGGMNWGESVNMGAAILDGLANNLTHGASITSTIAQYQRRKEDWELQKNMADWDTQQIEAQIEAAKVRIDLAKAELDVHNKSIEHSRQVEQFYKDKFTNKDLYQWMVGRLSSLYFQTYKIALDMANSTQRAYQYELNKDDTYIQSTSWDSNKKGLLAGESLMLGLNQLEKAYLDGNDRRLEIEKIISLRQLDPLAFFKLIKEGSCTFNFDEKLFALDFPSHYCRQIKTISVSIPAVVGPYQNINATLTQTSNKVLIKPDANAEKWLLTQDGDEPDTGILRQNWRQTQQIAISKGTNDSGLFMLNFQDERYLPFEGTGVNSSWKLDLPKASNPIDFTSITDVIITVSYTALEGGSTISNAVADNFKTFSGNVVRNLKPELLQNSDPKSLSFTVLPNLFRTNLSQYKLSKVSLVLLVSQYKLPDNLKLQIPDGSQDITLNKNNGLDLYCADLESKEYKPSAPTWSLHDPRGLFDSQNVTELILIVDYEGDINWTS